MKRFLIGSCIVGFLTASAPAMADSYYKHRTPPGIQIVVERGHALPPGIQKKYLAARYRDGHHYHGHKHYGHKYRYKDKYHYRDRDHGRYRDDYRHKPYYGYRDHIPTEHRVARIIRDTQALIDESRRRH